MELVLRYSIFLLFALAGCSNNIPTENPAYFSGIAHGETRGHYQLFKPEQARPIDMYSQVIAADTHKVPIPNIHTGETQKYFALGEVIAVAKLINPAMLFGKSPLDCAYCWRLNNLGERSINSLAYPGVGYTKSWKDESALSDIGANVDRALEELKSVLSASECMPRVIVDNGDSVTPISDSNTYFIGEYVCAEPDAIAKNPQFISSH